MMFKFMIVVLCFIANASCESGILEEGELYYIPKSNRTNLVRK